MLLTSIKAEQICITDLALQDKHGNYHQILKNIDVRLVIKKKKSPSTYKVFSWHLLMKPSSRDRHLLTSDNKETLCHH